MIGISNSASMGRRKRTTSKRNIGPNTTHEKPQSLLFQDLTGLILIAGLSGGALYCTVQTVFRGRQGNLPKQAVRGRVALPRSKNV